MTKTTKKVKKLLKNKKDKVLTGVIGGFSDYFDTDATLLRISWILLVAFTGFFPGVFAYIVAAFVMPEK